MGSNMGAISTSSHFLDEALEAAGLKDSFDARGNAHEDCPSCGAHRGMKLSLSRGQAQCSACGLNGPLLAYLHERNEARDWGHEPEHDAEIIVLEPHLPAVASIHRSEAPLRPHAAPTIETVALKTSDGKLGERIIISLLAFIFLGAGLAAATLSGFANYQAFSAGVGDPMQGQIWGWSGVIASVCSFGGFTFFWWHLSGKRLGEAFRALVFALAGAGTSIGGTSLYMMSNASSQSVEWQQAQQVQQVRTAQIIDWTRQLDGIPADTRSVEGLEAYIAGVEAAGRTHQKPYRDAQNELGLAKRRADLEAKIENARASLMSGNGNQVAMPKQTLPAWFFALMLEVFSSQGTSIAFVSLLLLYGAKPKDTDVQSLV